MAEASVQGCIYSVFWKDLSAYQPRISGSALPALFNKGNLLCGFQPDADPNDDRVDQTPADRDRKNPEKSVADLNDTKLFRGVIGEGTGKRGNPKSIAR